MAIATLSGLSHRHAGATGDALRDVDLEVAPGLLLVTGPSGSGKSTLLRVCNGLVPHFSGGAIAGAATVCGHDVLRTPTRVLARHCGFVFQDAEMQLVGGTVAREVAFGLENLGAAPERIGDRVDAALDRVHAAHLRDRPVASLSGGERQRVAVACALAADQPLLVLDEPTSQLDPEGAGDVLAVCVERARAGTALVVAEHRLDHLLPEADSVLLLRGGRRLALGPPAATARGLAAPPQVVELATRAGWSWTPLCGAALTARLGPPPAAPPAATARRGSPAWSLRGVVAGIRRRPVVGADGLWGAAGEVTVLMGPNGGGKTTLLRTLAGLLPPLAGAVERSPGRAAYLPQNPAAVLHRPTVAEEVAWTLRHARSDDDGVVDALAVRGLLDRHPRDLSSGERQRAAAAALLCGAPALALLDEPTRGMDAAARRALAAAVLALAAAGTAVVIATHDSELAAAVAGRVVEVGDGTARDAGPPALALSGPVARATQLGSLSAGGPVTVEDALALLPAWTRQAAVPC